MENSKMILSWDDTQGAMVELANTIKEKHSGVFQHILILTRGGMIPGYYLARELGIKSIKTMCLVSYGDSTQQEKIKHIQVDGFSEEISDVSNWLVIDDICDTGKTLSFVEKKYPGITSACLYVKEHRSCEFFYKQVPNDTWLVFPWEN